MAATIEINMTAKDNIRKFEYTDSKGNVTTREALFHRLPTENLNAIDLTEMSDYDRKCFEEFYDMYLKFLENVKAPTFEQWLEATSNWEPSDALKHRKFNIKRVKLLG